ncbi:chemotaxis protein CheX [Pullulanibacillus pueri]|uniref:CheY-P phosphatase CheX n=1 Tax=Pullulanibacillus pueri TaxID=1437324 RepID=A0A8J2ZT18_9BACL|nr:chemotaxis protein CheX [Pullulanibacillus pueri]MBM7684119.1 chemotaxis protein CheX [Pullulanibacillus pueri]GGH76684.1 CheY-P phosphatase CheX [Pullulanibacillus pueri]
MTTETLYITDLLNASIKSIKNVISIENSISKPKRLDHTFHINYGVLIGFVGEIRGKLMITGEMPVFSTIAEQLFGMPLEGEMLKSFTGELGNMIAGGISTDIGNQGVAIDITAPTIIEGDSNLSGFTKGIQIDVVFNSGQEFSLSLLIDQ